jgi:hypothetical protein
VSRYNDPPDEILDLGQPGRRENSGSPPSLPPMHIGEQPPADEEGTDRPRWWQWAVLFVAVVAGLIVGVLGANARRDAADLAAAESQVDLIVGEPLPSTHPRPQFQVPLYNAGPMVVELLSIRPNGWSIAESAVQHPITIPPDRWVPVRVRAVPDCTDYVSPDLLEVRVRTQAGESVISLALPMAGLMRDVHTAACRSFNQLGAYVDGVEIVAPLRADTLTMRLQIHADDPNLRFALTDLTATAPGFGLIHASLPVQFEPGEVGPDVSRPVDVTWEIVDCEAAQALSDVYLELGFESANGDRQTGRAPLPGRALAAMARFDADQCGVAPGST